MTMDPSSQVLDLPSICQNKRLTEKVTQLADTLQRLTLTKRCMTAADVPHLATLCSNYLNEISNLASDINASPKNDAVLKEYISVINDVALIPGIKDSFIEKMSPRVFEVVCDPSANVFFSRAVLKMFNVVLKKSDYEMRQRIILQDNLLHLCKLIDLLGTCGDYELQLSILETIFRMCSEEQIREHCGDLFPEDTELRVRFLDIDVPNFDVKSRRFLNFHNSKITNIFSIVSSLVVLGELKIKHVKGFDDIDGLWVDFNLVAESISFYADFNESGNDYLELVTVLACDVDKVETEWIKSFVHLTLTMSAPCLITTASSRRTVDVRAVKMFFLHDERSLQLLKRVLPDLFGDKFDTLGSQRSERTSPECVPLKRCRYNSLYEASIASINSKDLRHALANRSEPDQTSETDGRSLLVSPTSELNESQQTVRFQDLVSQNSRTAAGSRAFFTPVEEILPDVCSPEVFYSAESDVGEDFVETFSSRYRTERNADHNANVLDDGRRKSCFKGEVSSAVVLERRRRFSPVVWKDTQSDSLGEVRGVNDARECEDVCTDTEGDRQRDLNLLKELDLVTRNVKTNPNYSEILEEINVILGETDTSQRSITKCSLNEARKEVEELLDIIEEPVNVENELEQEIIEERSVLDVKQPVVEIQHEAEPVATVVVLDDLGTQNEVFLTPPSRLSNEIEESANTNVIETSAIEQNSSIFEISDDTDLGIECDSKNVEKIDEFQRVEVENVPEEELIKECSKPDVEQSVVQKPNEPEPVATVVVLDDLGTQNEVFLTPPSRLPNETEERPNANVIETSANEQNSSIFEISDDTDLGIECDLKNVEKTNEFQRVEVENVPEQELIKEDSKPDVEQSVVQKPNDPEPVASVVVLDDSGHENEVFLSPPSILPNETEEFATANVVDTSANEQNASIFEITDDSDVGIGIECDTNNVKDIYEFQRVEVENVPEQLAVVDLSEDSCQEFNLPTQSKECVRLQPKNTTMEPEQVAIIDSSNYNCDSQSENGINQSQRNKTSFKVTILKQISEQIQNVDLSIVKPDELLVVINVPENLQPIDLTADDSFESILEPPTVKETREHAPKPAENPPDESETPDLSIIMPDQTDTNLVNEDIENMQSLIAFTQLSGREMVRNVREEEEETTFPDVEEVAAEIFRCEKIAFVWISAAEQRAVRSKLEEFAASCGLESFGGKCDDVSENCDEIPERRDEMVVDAGTDKADVQDVSEPNVENSTSEVSKMRMKYCKERNRRLKCKNLGLIEANEENMQSESYKTQSPLRSLENLPKTHKNKKVKEFSTVEKKRSTVIELSDPFDKLIILGNEEALPNVQTEQTDADVVNCTDEVSKMPTTQEEMSILKSNLQKNRKERNRSRSSPRCNNLRRVEANEENTESPLRSLENVRKKRKSKRIKEFSVDEPKTCLGFEGNEFLEENELSEPSDKLIVLGDEEAPQNVPINKVQTEQTDADVVNCTDEVSKMPTTQEEMSVLKSNLQKNRKERNRSRSSPRCDNLRRVEANEENTESPLRWLENVRKKRKSKRIKEFSVDEPKTCLSFEGNEFLEEKRPTVIELSQPSDKLIVLGDEEAPQNVPINEVQTEQTDADVVNCTDEVSKMPTTQEEMTIFESNLQKNRKERNRSRSSPRCDNLRRAEANEENTESPSRSLENVRKKRKPKRKKEFSVDEPKTCLGFEGNEFLEEKRPTVVELSELSDKLIVLGDEEAPQNVPINEVQTAQTDAEVVNCTDEVSKMRTLQDEMSGFESNWKDRNRSHGSPKSDNLRRVETNEENTESESYKMQISSSRSLENVRKTRKYKRIKEFLVNEPETCLGFERNEFFEKKLSTVIELSESWNKSIVVDNEEITENVPISEIQTEQMEADAATKDVEQNDESVSPIAAHELNDTPHLDTHEIEEATSLTNDQISDDKSNRSTCDVPQQSHATQLTEVSNFERDRSEWNETLNKTETTTKRNEEFNVKKTSKRRRLYDPNDTSHLSAVNATKTPAVVAKVFATPKGCAPKRRKRKEKSPCTKEVLEQSMLSWCNFAPNEPKMKMTDALMARSNQHLNKTTNEMFADLNVTEKSKKKVNVSPRKRPSNTKIVTSPRKRRRRQETERQVESPDEKALEIEPETSVSEMRSLREQACGDNLVSKAKNASSNKKINIMSNIRLPRVDPHNIFPEISSWIPTKCRLDAETSFVYYSMINHKNIIYSQLFCPMRALSSPKTYDEEESVRSKLSKIIASVDELAKEVAGPVSPEIVKEYECIQDLQEAATKYRENSSV